MIKTRRKQGAAKEILNANLDLHTEISINTQQTKDRETKKHSDISRAEEEESSVLLLEKQQIKYLVTKIDNQLKRSHALSLACLVPL